MMLLFAACSSPWATPDAVLYRDARRLLRCEHYQEAEARTETALARVSTKSNWYWKLRLLRAEILLARREARLANAALDFTLPSPPASKADLARYRLCQGYAAALLQDYSLARSRLDVARDLARASDDETLLAEIELRMGYVAVRDGRAGEASARFEQVRDIAIRQRDPYLRMNATGNLGYLQLKSFQYEAAIAHFEETLAAAQSLGALESQARCMGNLGFCYYRLGNYDKALRYFQEADEHFQNTGNRYERQVWLGNIGSIFLGRREYIEAASYYRRALDVARALGDRENIATWLNNLALISIETGDLPSASRYNDEALNIKRELNDTREMPFSTLNAGRIALAKGDNANANALFRHVLKSAGDDPSLLLDAHAGLATALARAERNSAAKAEFETTLSMLNHQRSMVLRGDHKLTWFASLISFYQSYVAFLLNRGDVLAALEVADASRARLLADKLDVPHEQLHAKSTGYRRIARKADSTILFYWVCPERSFLWVISSDEVSLHALPGAAELAHLVNAHKQAIENLEDPVSSAETAGAKLYALLVAPAGTAIRKTRRVILLPDGPLYSLNFETLPVLQPRPHYWIEDAVISVTPSLRLLAPSAPKRSGDNKSLLLIGNPTASDPEFPPLPFAGQEVERIQKSLPAFRKTVRCGSEARPEAYSEAGPGTFTEIHFVAHSAANWEEPLQSAIILSAGKSSNKLLARDLMGIPIHAELVTLSSCRSAAAKSYAGEGLVGFSWAFLHAGAQNVIASLWDVNDRSTSVLMSDLYRNIGAGSMPLDALRLAKLSMIHGRGVWRKPWYWATFQLYTLAPGRSSS